MRIYCNQCYEIFLALILRDLHTHHSLRTKFQHQSQTAEQSSSSVAVFLNLGPLLGISDSIWLDLTWLFPSPPLPSPPLCSPPLFPFPLFPFPLPPILSPPLLFSSFSQDGFSVWPWLSRISFHSGSRRSACLCLQSAGLKCTRTARLYWVMELAGAVAGLVERLPSRCGGSHLWSLCLRAGSGKMTLSLRLACSTQWVTGQPEPGSETLCPRYHIGYLFIETNSYREPWLSRNLPI